MKKIVVFASGSGTNAENIIKYFEKSLSANVVTVFTNNPNATVIEKVKNYGIPIEIFSKTDLNEGDVLQKINVIKPDWIVLAGFLLKFPQNIITEYPNRIINIHPALLPKHGGKGMYGMHIHQAVIDNRETETGITIHYVNENYDEGAIIFQQKINIDNLKTAQQVAAKIHQLEQEYFPKIIESLL
ncbi:formyltetrahydrofolate-dependent phosphoribosylglycinamide formyltransferase [Flavobacterium segetis]|uniref:phosphoribosylglycinamide formyltransferase 1 n=1 Tax=Flavobacterium segetis TaxID=271157 RepID=A0A1M5FZ23_9FLAO|nr:phosphoribosylglycinamide formyltransferase [Flavobacterium segetis]SHF96775.1 formyltetrahydrofolate-dependent phosphoribosylglycinamide formyltransferase [Flavobacterium segetis]